MRESQSNAANAERQSKELRQQAYLHLLKLKPPPSLVRHASAFVDDLKPRCVVLATSGTRIPFSMVVAIRSLQKKEMIISSPELKMKKMKIARCSNNAISFSKARRKKERKKKDAYHPSCGFLGENTAYAALRLDGGSSALRLEEIIAQNPSSFVDSTVSPSAPEQGGM